MKRSIGNMVDWRETKRGRERERDGGRETVTNYKKVDMNRCLFLHVWTFSAQKDHLRGIKRGLAEERHWVVVKMTLFNRLLWLQAFRDGSRRWKTKIKFSGSFFLMSQMPIKAENRPKVILPPWIIQIIIILYINCDHLHTLSEIYEQEEHKQFKNLPLRVIASTYACWISCIISALHIQILTFYQM